MKVLQDNRFWLLFTRAARALLRLILPYRTPKVGDVVIEVMPGHYIDRTLDKGVVLSISPSHLVVRWCYPGWIPIDEPPFFERKEDCEYGFYDMEWLSKDKSLRVVGNSLK